MTQATTWSVPLVGPASPTAMAQRMDESLDALLTGHSGSARPSYAEAGTIWEDTSVANETRLWFYDGSQDILVAVVDTSNDRVELAPQPLVDVASATTTDIGAVKSRNIRITGTTTITSFGTVRAGTTRTLYFAAALTLTYNATSMITPTGSSLAVDAGDSIDVVSLGSGNWRVLRHVRSAKSSITLGSPVTASGTSVDFTGIPANAKRITLNLFGISTNGTSDIVVQVGTSGGVETSGYVGSISRLGTAATATIGTSSGTYAAIANAVNAAYLFYGKVVFENATGNLWTISGKITTGNNDYIIESMFAKTTASSLDRVRLTTVGGANTFDAGTTSISWEV